MNHYRIAMNYLLYPLLLILLFVSGALYAQDSTYARVSNADEVSISCSGSCSCSLQGELGGDKSFVSCTCNECTMQVTITESGLQGKDTSIYNLSGGASMEIPMIKEYMDFENASGELFELNRVNIYRDGDDVAVQFRYKDEQGDTNTVLFAKYAGKTYRISCDGMCGCREVYSFETNSASCSCEDCIMTVEEVSNQ